MYGFPRILNNTTNAFEKTTSVQSNLKPIKSFSGECLDRVGISLGPVSICLYVFFGPACIESVSSRIRAVRIVDTHTI